MHQVAVLDHAKIEVSELVEAFEAHSIVVINSIIDRDRAHVLRDETTLAMKSWNGTGPDVYYNEFEVIVGDQRWWAPTLTHSDRNNLDLSDTRKLVQRAMETWVARGCAFHFVYSNTAPRTCETSAA